MTDAIIKIKIPTYSNHDKSASEESKWNQQGIDYCFFFNLKKNIKL